MHKPTFNSDFLAVTLSVLVQIPLAIFLGHYYDQTIFLQTGYLVGSGLNPYQPHAITVFSNPYLTGVNSIIGYPPPWTFLLGLIYRSTYALTPNIFLYNFATKIPIIAGNIALAYATKTIMEQQNMPQKAVRFAWLFLLFNPFTLLTTAAWGEFDTTVALLCVAGLYLLSKGKPAQSALLLGLSFVLKPISLPLLGLPLLYSTPKNRQKNVIVTIIIASVAVGLWLLPFPLAGWAAPASLTQVTSYFGMAGGMTVFNVIDVFWRTSAMPSATWFLGYLWIPALLAGYFWVYRNPPKTLVSLCRCAVVLLLVFFISRSWLSEQNINLLFPFMLILVGSGTLKPRSVHLTWIIALAFLVLNMTLPQLLFLVYPPIIPLKEAFDINFGVARLSARFAVTLVWFLVASGILLKVTAKNHRFTTRKSLNNESPLTYRGSTAARGFFDEVQT